MGPKFVEKFSFAGEVRIRAQIQSPPHLSHSLVFSVLLF